MTVACWHPSAHAGILWSTRVSAHAGTSWSTRVTAHAGTSESTRVTAHTGTPKSTWVSLPQRQSQSVYLQHDSNCCWWRFAIRRRISPDSWDSFSVSSMSLVV